jgi:hypothetical protein
VCWLKGRCSFVNDTERKETSNETASWRQRDRSVCGVVPTMQA